MGACCNQKQQIIPSSFIIKSESIIKSGEKALILSNISNSIISLGLLTKNGNTMASKNCKF